MDYPFASAKKLCQLLIKLLLQLRYITEILLLSFKKINRETLRVLRIRILNL